MLVPVIEGNHYHPSNSLTVLIRLDHPYCKVNVEPRSAQPDVENGLAKNSAAQTSCAVFPGNMLSPAPVVDKNLFLKSLQSGAATSPLVLSLPRPSLKRIVVPHYYDLSEDELAKLYPKGVCVSHDVELIA